MFLLRISESFDFAKLGVINTLTWRTETLAKASNAFHAGVRQQECCTGSDNWDSIVNKQQDTNSEANQ